MIPVTGSSSARKSTYSDSPPLKRNVSSRWSCSSRTSRTCRLRSGTRNAVCRARSHNALRSKVVSLVKICGSGQNRIRVPVRFFGTEPRGCRPVLRVKGASGPSPSKIPGTPRRKDIPYVLPARSTSTSRRADSALTTEAPTPCRPPAAPYEPPPNLPPACSLVITNSTPVSRDFFCTSTGIPRPLSRTSTLPSGSRDTSTVLQNPPSASSTALSMISHTQCIKPLASVDPMYMPGRLRTASRPSRTVSASAE